MKYKKCEITKHACIIKFLGLKYYCLVIQWYMMPVTSTDVAKVVKHTKFKAIAKCWLLMQHYKLNASPPIQHTHF